MKKTYLATIFGMSLLCGGFAEETRFEIDYSKLDPQFNESSHHSGDSWHKYNPISISELVYRHVIVELEEKSQIGEDPSVTTAFNQVIKDDAYLKDTEGFYRKYYNIFNSYQFYSGLNPERDFYFSTQIPGLRLYLPTISLGKILSSTETSTQFLEMRTLFGLVTAIYYGVSF